MAAPADRLAAVRSLLETAPDGVVRDLESALQGQASGALAPVRAMVRAEIADRAVRDAVLAPVAPLCAPRPDGFQQTLFPSGVLNRVWRSLRALEPRAVTVARSNLSLSWDGDASVPAIDDLCRAAAAALREDRPEMAGARRYLEEFRPGAAEQFAGFLDLAPLARPALRRLPLWLRQMSEEHAAVVRLLFKDAAAVAADAAPRLTDILLAHSPQPWKLLRIVSAISNGGGEDYLASSELAGFCERVVADIERRVNLLRALEFDDGPEAVETAMSAQALALAEISEFEEQLELKRDGPWGQRIGRHRLALSSLTEGLLKKCPRAVAEALPTQTVRLGGRVTRAEPRIEEAPDPRLVGRALAALTLFDRSRLSAAGGGYGAVRAKVGEEIAHRLDGYVEDLLALVHAARPERPAHAAAYIETAARFMALAQGEASAQIVRRRAAAAA